MAASPRPSTEASQPSQSTSGASSPPAVIEQQPAPSVKQAPVPSITLEEAQPPKPAAQSSQRAEVQKIALAPALVIASDADNTSHEPRLQTPSSENGPAANPTAPNDKPHASTKKHAPPPPKKQAPKPGSVSGAPATPSTIAADPSALTAVTMGTTIVGGNATAGTELTGRDMMKPTIRTSLAEDIVASEASIRKPAARKPSPADAYNSNGLTVNSGISPARKDSTLSAASITSPAPSYVGDRSLSASNLTAGFAAGDEVIAIRKFDATLPKQLNLKPGSVIVVKRTKNGWIQGNLINPGTRVVITSGWFPANCVQFTKQPGRLGMQYGTTEAQPRKIGRSSLFKSTIKKDGNDIEVSEDAELETIRISKHGAPLGITLTGGLAPGKEDSSIIISKILDASVAQRDGRLQVGDKIIDANGGESSMVDYCIY